MTWQAYGPAFGLALVLAAPAVPCRAEAMHYVYDSPESPLDRRYVYQWQVLEQVLLRTEADFGPYTLTPSVPMTESRQVFELEHGTGRLTIMYRDWSPDYADRITAVHIPVDRGLVGYRVFLVRAAELPQVAAVRTLDDLRRFRVGLGADWIDVKIFHAANIPVVTGTSYDGLFTMLLHERFDLFSRGASEVLGEFDERRIAMPDLALDPTLCLYYPATMYFWFGNSDAGRRLGKRVEAGLRAMVDDGSFQRFFASFYGPTLARLQLGTRRVIRVPNPVLDPQAPLADHRLWYDPAARP